jgi:hypothetical protein
MNSISVTSNAGDSSRIDIKLVAGDGEEIQIIGVKTYGSLMGKLFKFLGYANGLTSTDQKTYCVVNLNSLLKHTLEARITTSKDLKSKNIEEKHIKEAIDNIKKDKKLAIGQQELTAESIHAVYASAKNKLPWAVLMSGKAATSLY